MKWTILPAAALALWAAADAAQARAETVPFLGEIQMMGNSFCPRGWAETDGRVFPIRGNEALFSLLRFTYGGDGTTTFALPDLRGRIPQHVGEGDGLSFFQLGNDGGVEAVPLGQAEMRAHTHDVAGGAPGQLVAAEEDATTEDPNGGHLAVPGSAIYGPPANPVDMGAGSVTAEIDIRSGAAGSSALLDLRQPYLTVRYCIALQGTYPPKP